MNLIVMEFDEDVTGSGMTVPVVAGKRTVEVMEGPSNTYIYI